MSKVIKPPRTQDFDAVHTSPSMTKPGRYLYLFKGQKRFVFRWWNGKNWQLNRRKVALSFKPVAGDTWAGAAELHPAVEKQLSFGKSYRDTDKLPRGSGVKEFANQALHS